MINQKLLDVAADWWIEQITGQKLNWDNGAQNEGSREDQELGMMMFMLGNLVAGNAREKITPEQIKIFRDSLIRQIKENCDKQEAFERDIVLSVDYHPGRYLYEAAEEAKIDEYAFPCKTVMWINEHSVSAKCGYGADAKELIRL
jgi:hypothetical protein